MDRKTLITLNVAALGHETTASMSQTAFNMPGFIQPTCAENASLRQC